MNQRMPVEEAAAYVGLSVSFMNRARLRGDGPVFLKFGRRVVYDKADIDQWLCDSRRTSTGGPARNSGGRMDGGFAEVVVGAGLTSSPER